jgi:glycosyltransferase involved in cell wall biosynthesis
MKALLASLADRLPGRRVRPKAALTRPAGAPRQLLIDVSVIFRHDAKTGIQRVVRAIWDQLPHFDLTGVEVVPVFASRHHGYCRAPDDFLAHAEDRPADELRLIAVGAGDMFLGLDLAAHLLPYHEGQVRAWKAAGATIHLVVYDLLPITGASWFNPRMQVNFARWLSVLSRQANSALCISDHVARELRDWLRDHAPERADAIRVSRIRLGADLAASLPSNGVPEGGEDLLASMAARPTILMVGTIEPRKAYDVALDALERLWADPADAPQLVIVGKAGWRTAPLQKRMDRMLESGAPFHWLSGVSDEYLDQLYGAARLVLVTSYAEGFGLPVIEALHHGRLVLTRDLPVFREFSSSHIRFFGDDAAAPLASDIIDALDEATGPAAAEQEQTLALWRDTAADVLAALGLPAQPLP